MDYYHGGDKPYLISGADDHAVRIWDYQNKTCVQTLEGHTYNVSAGNAIVNEAVGAETTKSHSMSPEKTTLNMKYQR